MLEKILQAFDLARRPFGAMPDPKCFFTTATLQETANELRLNIERGQGISILTGDAGSGKSLLLERVAIELRSEFDVVLLRHAKFQSSRAVLQEILNELGCEFEGLDETELRLALRRRVQAARPEQEAVALLIDEADNFPTDALEELRILADLAEEGLPLVRLLLCGQWRLEERLTERDFDALNQRVSSHLSMQPLSTSESADYIRFRLNWAGGKPESVFTERALQFVVRAAAGIPRCLNLLADHCLYLALNQQERPVLPETVQLALSELKQLPLHWNDLHDLSAFSANEDETLFEVPNDDTVFNMSATDTETFQTRATLPARDATARRDNEPLPHNAEASTSCFEFGGDEEPAALSVTSEAAHAPTVFEFGADSDEVLDNDSPSELRSMTTTDERSHVAPSFEPQEPASTVEFDQRLTAESDRTTLVSQAAESLTEAADLQPARSLRACFHDTASTADSCVTSFTSGAESASSEGCCFTITAPRRSQAVELANAVAALAQQAAQSNAPTLEPLAAQHDVDHSETVTETDFSAPGAEPSIISIHSANQFSETATIELHESLESSARTVNDNENDSATDAVVTTVMEFELHSDNDRSVLSETSLTHEEQPVPQFVEEIVVDHYAALQEPEFSGVIWNLARQVTNDAPTPSSSSFASTSQVDDMSDFAEPLADEPPRMTLGFEEAIRRRDAFSTTRQPRNVERAASYETESTHADAADDDGVVEDIRPLKPNRYLDAIVPLINDIIDPEGDTVLPETTPRSRAEIEAELIDMLTSGEPGTEDLIGSEVLDLCLDAQAAIRQAQDAVAKSLQSQLREIDADEEAFENDFGDTFDVVQPDDDDASFTAVATAERRPEKPREPSRNEPVETPQDQSQRPFRRLFSELRRRQRLVG